MGTCFSKKKGSPPPVAPIHPPPPPPPPPATAHYVAVSSAPAAKQVVDPKLKPPGKEGEIEEVEQSKAKKEIFIIKHRKSHDDRDRDPEGKTGDGDASAPNPITPQVSEDHDNKAATGSKEVDAILIQCGRLSRSSSGKAASSSCDRSKKYSGSKRSYDFDNNCDNEYQVTATNSEDAQNKIESNNQGHRHRQSSRSSPSSQGRRRTPSRERNQQQRSSSRERRTSRSPGRRLSMEQNNTSNNAAAAAATANANVSNSDNRPGKMKMVPVSSLVMDKSNNVETATAIKRISVKRNAGVVEAAAAARSAASPRSQSPARALSRSSSRKAEHSPYRRNPLSEIDPNYPQAHINNTATNLVNQMKPNVEINSNRIVAHGSNCRSSTTSSTMDKVVEPAGVHCLKSQTLTRSRSSRRSRDFDIDPETFVNPPPSYTKLLLEDIQNFHQQNTNTTAVSLPQCVTKACSILEAVADLNSASSSNLSSAFSTDKKSPPVDQTNKSSCYYNCSLGANPVQTKDIPFVESEVCVDDDLIQPSFHKYVTVQRGGGDMEDQESSGSNSFVSGSQQPHLGFSSSSWEPSSADSSNCWTSRSSTREEDRSFDMDEAARRRLSGRNPQSSGSIGPGKLAAARGLHPIPVIAAAAST